MNHIHTINALDMVQETAPLYDYRSASIVPKSAIDPDHLYHGRSVKWDLSDSNYIVEVPVDKIQVTNENIWNFEHAAGLAEIIEERDVVLAPPSGRLYRISEQDVVDSQEYAETDELEYQLDLSEPWDESDAGTFYVFLLDGNHRTIAAMAAGEQYIPVIVGQNYRDEVLPEEWL